MTKIKKGSILVLKNGDWSEGWAQGDILIVLTEPTTCDIDECICGGKAVFEAYHQPSGQKDWFDEDQVELRDV